MSRHWIADQLRMGETTMSLQSWLQNLRSALTSCCGHRHPRRCGSLRAGTPRPRLEVLEDRLTPSFSGPMPLDASSGFAVEWAPPFWYPQLADFTSDGIYDQIGSDWFEVVVRPGRGDGTFADPIRTRSSIPWASVGYQLVVADFNGD